MKVPSGGIIFGYFFFVCVAISSSDNRGPGYLGASLRRRAGWDGGTNLEGFSRTRGFDVECFFLLETLRMEREVEVGTERRVRHIALRCGSRNRGIDVVGGIAYSEAPRWSSVVLSRSSDPTFKILVRQPIPGKTAHQYFRSVFCRTVWLTLQRLSNVQLLVGWRLLRCGRAGLTCLVSNLACSPQLILSFSRPSKISLS